MQQREEDDARKSLQRAARVGLGPPDGEVDRLARTFGVRPPISKRAERNAVAGSGSDAS